MFSPFLDLFKPDTIPRADIYIPLKPGSEVHIRHEPSCPPPLSFAEIIVIPLASSSLAVSYLFLLLGTMIGRWIDVLFRGPTSTTTKVPMYDEGTPSDSADQVSELIS